MLPERARRAMLRDLVDAANRLLLGLKEQNATVIAEALADAQSARARLNDGYLCDMSRAFDAIDTCIQAVSRGVPADAELKALRTAVDEAYGYVNDPFTTGDRWTVVHYGGGVRRVFGGEPQRQRLEVDAKTLCDRFGIPLVAALLRVMAGTNRIGALLNMIKLNSRHSRAGSVAQERNFLFITFMTFAYLKELTRVLNDLSAAGIEARLTDPDPWYRLKELQRYWERDKRKTVRDDVMFHLGWQPQTQEQLKKHIDAYESLSLFDTDLEHGELCMRFTAGEGLVMTSSGLQLSDCAEIADEAVDSYGPLFECVIRIVDDLLRQCGARLPPIESVGLISLL